MPINTRVSLVASQVVIAERLRRFKSDAAIRAYCNMNQLTDWRVSKTGQVRASDPYDRIIVLGWVS